MRIAVDVMGGDHGCGVVIEGVKRALEADSKISALYLVGKQEDIHAAMQVSGLVDKRVHIVHSTEVMTMEDKPTVALRKKKDSSIAKAVDLVAEGKADAVISLGNTGGILTFATFKLRPLPGVERAGIATVIPAPDNEFVLLDSGANIECKPLHLAQYAVMGSVYSREILRYKNPRVGLLCNGTEEGKGNELTKEAYRLCKQLDLNFVGNVEGHDLFANKVDVVVCDGFVGNIVLKTCESLAVGIFAMLKRELVRNPKRQLGAYLAQNAFRVIKRRMDPEIYGGAPLLGLNGIVMKAHGSAKEKSIMNAIRITTETVQNRINKTIVEEIQRANERLAATKSEE
ncbi:phosphate acyltransferase PlsX [Pedosphaera parvula]|uniref:Phosphate acyltransferase n=1 Tax=Pedosphaera parvula (strain Ellin514) TaxID=320771 RepID=B9XBG4_PEDPL|nr:phosphate acyltransferase PlsX [Pedosphaera parvula]EEF62849.1 fatty acid/phospholipid synthesis protein PlsX [Pedosphaera parvula Ellin514]